MTTNKKLVLLVFAASILTPYIGTIFFVRTVSLFLLLPLDALALIVLLLTMSSLARKEAKKERKKWYAISAALGIGIYFLSYGYLLDAADYVFFKARQSQLDKLVLDIEHYSKIKEMSDAQRYWKSLNHISIENDSSLVEAGRKYYINDVLVEQHIDRNKYEDFRKALIAVDLISFTTLEDGTISFTLDGMLDNCEGYAYSVTGQQPAGNDCGRIIHWKKMADHWYVWYTT